MSSQAQPLHLLRVDQTMLEFAQLVAALRQDGRRVGWLEWSPGVRSNGSAVEKTPVPVLEAAEAGVLRAVTVAPDHTVAVKPRRGAPILRDIVREHFRGCNLLLVHTTDDLPIPRLEKTEKGWRIVPPDAEGPGREWSTEDLVAALRRPHPFAKEKS